MFRLETRPIVALLAFRIFAPQEVLAGMAFSWLPDSLNLAGGKQFPQRPFSSRARGNDGGLEQIGGNHGLRFGFHFRTGCTVNESVLRIGSLNGYLHV